MNLEKAFGVLGIIMSIVFTAFMIYGKKTGELDFDKGGTIVLMIILSYMAVSGLMLTR